jgi:RNA polymerase sigma-70 factor, ECF subfamily
MLGGSHVLVAYRRCLGNSDLRGRLRRRQLLVAFHWPVADAISHAGARRVIVVRHDSCGPTIGECFDDVVVPQLDAAHRLARWLMRNEHDAEDVVQEASLRALRYFRTFTGGNGRAWFLRIVRNTCTGWPGHRRHLPADTFDEERHGGAEAAADPETLLIQNHAAAALDQALVHLPDRVRELLILRELKGLSYREIADVMGIPMGTVMSSLSRARQALRSVLNDQLKQSGIPKRTHPREQEAEAVLV